MNPAPPALELRGIGKRFGDTWVLRDVHLSVAHGKVHALVGHNGAGKSTLMKIVLGVLSATEGDVYVDGARMEPGQPGAARALGLGMVFQERSLIGTLNGLDNVFLNAERVNGARLIRRREESGEAREICARLGIPSSLLERRVAEISTVGQEMLEIAKALRMARNLLILDEPTAPLTRREIAVLFEVIRNLATGGTGVILITHHLPEVFAIADDVTCLREGSVTLSCPTRDTSMPELIEAMLGAGGGGSGRGSVAPPGPEGRRRDPGRARREVALSVRSLKVAEKLADVSFDIFTGEILGVAGIAGSGRSTLARALFGDIPWERGEVRLQGVPYRPRSPRAAIRRGVYLIPEDRAVRGLMLTKSILENGTLSILQRLTRFFLLRMSRGRRLMRELLALLNVRARGPDQVVSELSGGNQQKVVLTKALASGARLLLLDEPTFGVDIGAAGELARQVRDQAEAGSAVLWVSSDFHEMCQVVDRVIVLADGAVRGSIASGEEGWSEATLLAAVQRGQYGAWSGRQSA